MEKEEKNFVNEDFTLVATALREVGKTIDKGFDRIEAKIDGLQSNLGIQMESLDRTLSGITKRLINIEVRVSGFESRVGDVDVKFAATESDIRDIKAGISEMSRALKSQQKVSKNGGKSMSEEVEEIIHTKLGKRLKSK